MTFNAFLLRVFALPKSTKITGIAIFTLIVLATVVLVAKIHPVTELLFAQPLHADQLTEVEEQLAQWNVAFTSSADNVLVDVSRRNEILLRLSLAGVPHPHVATTNEALANVGVLTPEAVVDAQTRSGLAGEIELALRSVDGVEDARVIIAPAKVAEFADQSSSQASASVRLRLRPGVHLSSASIGGMRAFVAASVTGLDAARVTILDDAGIAMSALNGYSDDERALESSLQSALDEALGAGVAIVRIHAEYSSVEREAHDVRRLPLGPISRESATESFDGQGRRYQKNDERDERGSDLRESASRSGAGALAHINTAILLDAQKNVPIENVRLLAAATVGFDAKRGDTLSVQAVDFHRPRAPARDVWFLLYGALAPLLPTAAVVIGLLAGLQLLVPHARPFVKYLVERASIGRVSAAVSGYSPAQVRGALAHEPPHAAAAVISALPAATAAAVLELYPPHEREAIVARMQRAHSPLIPDPSELLQRA